MFMHNGPLANILWQELFHKWVTEHTTISIPVMLSREICDKCKTSHYPLNELNTNFFLISRITNQNTIFSMIWMWIISYGFCKQVLTCIVPSIGLDFEIIKSSFKSNIKKIGDSILLLILLFFFFLNFNKWKKGN